MAIFDVREEDNEEITKIVFAHEEDDDGDFQACTIIEAFKGSGYICIYNTYNCSEGSVSISSIEHAENLIKALRKAIELGWIK